ncbi:MAG: hypothetical protein KF688_10480 [Pirellulales bacterium]|nr:hypothetical protein [Pirellulales bacterium]
MKSRYVLSALALATITLNTASAALYVTRVGDGSGSLTNAAVPVFVEKFTDVGAPLGTISLPTTASESQRALVLGGTATSVGFINASGDGNYLFLAGFDAAVGTASVNSTTSAVANRVVGRISVSDDSIDTSTAFTDTSYSGDNIRSVVSTNGTDIWTAGTASSGANGGVRYTTFGSNSSTRVSSTPTNTRVVNIYNGQLYVSSGTAAFLGVSTVGTGLPTMSDEATSTLAVNVTGTGTGTASSYDFWFKDDNTVYIADDRTLANGGGIQKWSFDSGSSVWGLDYTLNVGAGARGLAGTMSGGNAVLYTITADNPSRLVSITDDNGVDSVFSTLASAATNTQFRGVAFIPSGGGGEFAAADFNENGAVDGTDLGIWSNGYGLTGAPKSSGDATGDGDVDGRDFLVWQRQYTGTPVAVAAVPEPASVGLTLVVLGGLALAARRGRHS